MRCGISRSGAVIQVFFKPVHQEIGPPKTSHEIRRRLPEHESHGIDMSLLRGEGIRDAPAPLFAQPGDSLVRYFERGAEHGRGRFRRVIEMFHGG